MQTERVTFLTSPEHKAALDAFAASNGKSVGHVLREASASYMARAEQPVEEDEDEAALAIVLPLIEEMIPQWNARVDSMERAIDRARRAVDAALAGDPA